MESLLILSILLIGCLYCLNRNQKVYTFRNKIVDIEYNYNENKGAFKDFNFHDRYSYHEMLFSFKPLTFEAWFTPEECKILNQFDKK